MTLNMASPVVRAAFGMFFGVALVMVIRFIPGLEFLNIWHAIGAGAFAAVGMIIMGRMRKASQVR
jgi:hypothetical protein